MREQCWRKRLVGGFGVVPVLFAAADPARAVETSSTPPVVVTAYVLLDELEIMRGRYSAAECDGTARYALSASGFVAVTERGGQEWGRSQNVTAVISCLRAFSDHSVLFVVAAPGGAGESAIAARARLVERFKAEVRPALRPTVDFRQ